VTEQCPVTSETLSAFVDCELSNEEQQKLAHHIVTCQWCSQRIGTIYSLKVLARGPASQPVAVPKGFWKRVRRRLDEIDAVARKVVSIGPRRAPTKRLAALAGIGVLLIIVAVGIRGALVPRSVGWMYLAKAHRAAMAQLIPPVVVRQHLAPSGPAVQTTWQPTQAQTVHLQMCRGRQVVYWRPGAVVSYFILPCDSLDVSGLDFIYQQGGLRFYLTTSGELSIIAWRQGSGWCALVGAAGTEQLLELARVYSKPGVLDPGF